MSQEAISLPPPERWSQVFPQTLSSDVEAFAKLTADQAQDLRVEGGRQVLEGQRYARTNAAPSARLVLLGMHLQERGLNVRFAGSRSQDVTLYTGSIDPDILANMRGKKSEQWAYSSLSDRIGALGLLRSTVFEPDDRRHAIFRERCTAIKDTDPEALLQRAFMTSLLVRHLRPVELCIDHQLDDPEIQTDHGLYEIMRDQGVTPLDYIDLTELALRSTNLGAVGFQPVAEL